MGSEMLENVDQRAAGEENSSIATPPESPPETAAPAAIILERSNSTAAASLTAAAAPPAAQGVDNNPERKLPAEDPSTIIESLRARLLFERNSSKAAKKQAQELARKVKELEQSLVAEIDRRNRLQEQYQKLLAKLEEAGVETEDREREDQEVATQTKPNWRISKSSCSSDGDVVHAGSSVEHGSSSSPGSDSGSTRRRTGISCRTIRSREQESSELGIDEQVKGNWRKIGEDIVEFAKLRDDDCLGAEAGWVGRVVELLESKNEEEKSSQYSDEAMASTSNNANQLEQSVTVSGELEHENAETQKQEAEKAETQKQEAEIAETRKQEAETEKQEAEKAETQKQEAEKAETQKQEAEIAETRKQEAETEKQEAETEKQEAETEKQEAENAKPQEQEAQNQLDKQEELESNEQAGEKQEETSQSADTSSDTRTDAADDDFSSQTSVASKDPGRTPLPQATPGNAAVSRRAHSVETGPKIPENVDEDVEDILRALVLAKQQLRAQMQSTAPGYTYANHGTKFSSVGYNVNAGVEFFPPRQQQQDPCARIPRGYADRLALSGNSGYFSPSRC